jgi:hypothetical protein
MLIIYIYTIFWEINKWEQQQVKEQVKELQLEASH